MQNNLSDTNDLRYNLSLRLDNLGRRQAMHIRSQIIKELDIVGSTYHRWLLVRKNDSKDIPAYALRRFSTFLGVPMELLFNDKKEA